MRIHSFVFSDGVFRAVGCRVENLGARADGFRVEGLGLMG